MKSHLTGITLVEILMGIVISTLALYMAALLFTRSADTNAKITDNLNYEQATELLKTALADKAKCQVNAWNFDASAYGTPAVANDHTNGKTAPTSPAVLPYTTINGLVVTSSDPTRPQLLLKTKMNLGFGKEDGQRVEIQKIEISPVDSTRKIVRRIANDRYVELIRLSVTADFPKRGTDQLRPTKVFSIITTMLYEQSTGKISLCFQENPTINAASAIRSALLLSKTAGPPGCSIQSPAPTQSPAHLYIGIPSLTAPKHPNYASWCEWYGGAYPAPTNANPTPAFQPTAEMTYRGLASDKFCLAKSPRSSGQNDKSVQIFNSNFPKRDLPTSSDPIQVAEGRCPIELDSDVVTTNPNDAIFMRSDLYDKSSHTLALGCNGANGWAVSSCAVGSDGRGGALDVRIERDPAYDPITNRSNDYYCVFRQLDMNDTNFFLGRAYLSLVCSKVEQ